MKSSRTKTRSQSKKKKLLLAQNPIPETHQNPSTISRHEQVNDGMGIRESDLDLDPGLASSTGFQVRNSLENEGELESDQGSASSTAYPSDSEQTDPELGNSRIPLNSINPSNPTMLGTSGPRTNCRNSPPQHSFPENLTVSNWQTRSPLTRTTIAGPPLNEPHVHQLAKARRMKVEIDIFSKNVEKVIPALRAAMQAPPGIPIAEKLRDIRDFRDSLEFRVKKYNDAYQIFQGMADISDSANHLFEENQREHEEKLTEAEELLYKANKKIRELDQGLRDQADAKNREFEIALRSEKQKSELERATREEEWKREMDTKRLQSENELKERQLKYEQDLRTLRMEFETINVNKTPNKENSESGHSTHSTVKLPKIELPKFSGDKLRWREFWEMFENGIHSKPGLPAIDKFNYLKSNLGGEALRIVTGLRLCGENYEIAIKQLKDRYGDTQHIVETHY